MIKLLRKVKTIAIRLTLLLSVVLTGLSFDEAELKLIAPVSDHVTSNNAPLLTWTPVPCKYYEVWLDGRKIDSVAGDLNACVPFPQSFGRHAWHVTAIDGNREISTHEESFIIDDSPLEKIPDGALLLRNGWKIQSSVLAGQTAEELSGPAADTKGWYESSVPVTVLSALVRNGVFPNPYIGLNNMRIPDSNDDYNKDYDLLKYSHIPGKNPWKDPYWFVNSFELPPAEKGKTIRLRFSEINYRAEVWLNGKLVADTAQMAGMERNFSFDITSLISKGKNYLAVAVYPVDHPGKPSVEPITPLGAPGENMGDGLISKNYTKWDALGWDWQPAIRDREMGITEDVFIYTSGPLQINNVYVTSDLPLPDTTSATITISGNVVNHSLKPAKVLLKGTITSANSKFTIEQPVQLAPNQVFPFLWNEQNFKELVIRNPELWWPAGYGKPALYKLKLEIISGKESTAFEMNFGIREVETFIGKKERVYKINGREIYLKGGNWVMDMMLNWNARRYEDEILLTRNANLNILRVWGPTGVPPQAFYDAADKYGVLIWQDFLYDYWGTFRNRSGYNTPDDLYEIITTGIVKEYRNHPSLVIWCGGNEGANPREKLIMEKILAENDGRDSKHYLKISNGDGLHGGGPYHTLHPAEYFTHPKLNGFSSEIGPSGVPVMESIRKFMPDFGMNYLKERFPVNATWSYHDANDWAGSDTRKFSSYDDLIRKLYGAPETHDMAGAKNYIEKTQLLNYDVYRSSIEAINRQLWNSSSGILLWKSNSSWPSMVWQVYDWYLQSNAGYYGVKSAAEPVHVQFNRDSTDIVILNAGHKAFTDALISADLYNLKGEKIWQQQKVVDLEQNAVTHTAWKVPVEKEVCFLRLSVAGANGAGISQNTYWINEAYDYASLSDLPEARLSGKMIRKEGLERPVYELTLVNEGSVAAFMIACSLRGASSGMEILPSLWTSNYITLLPGETAKMNVRINKQDLSEKAVISCKAFNMKKSIIISEISQ